MPKLPPNIRAKDPTALSILRAVNDLAARHRSTEAQQDERMVERNRLLTIARAEGVSWADLSRVAGISDVSVMQAVERFQRDHPDADLTFKS